MLDAITSFEQSSRNAECVVCYEQSRSVVFLPCAHLCSCIPCSLLLTDCPVCRTPIEKVLRVYT
jgi:E3 ubiquitin-protein ligase MUL1